jgi:hypothetical protein
MSTPKVNKPATEPSLLEEILRPWNWFDESKIFNKAPFRPFNRERKNIIDSVMSPGFEYFLRT